MGVGIWIQAFPFLVQRSSYYITLATVVLAFEPKVTQPTAQVRKDLNQSFSDILTTTSHCLCL